MICQEFNGIKVGREKKNVRIKYRNLGQNFLKLSRSTCLKFHDNIDKGNSIYKEGITINTIDAIEQ